MLTLDQISFKIIPQSDFIKELEEYPQGEVSFDYETQNDRDFKLGLEVWDPDTRPFMFSLCLIDSPEKYLKCFTFDKLTPDQIAAFRTFLKSRKVWVFNCKFEGGITWKLLNEFYKFEDVMALYKVDGMITTSLKDGTAHYLKKPTWSEAAWSCVETLQVIIKYLKSEWLSKYEAGFRKSRTISPIAHLLAEGDIRGLFMYCRKLSTSLSKQERDFINIIYKTRDLLSSYDILKAIKLSNYDSSKINLSSVPLEIVAEYCCYDSYATAYNKLFLWESCKKQYEIYLHQIYLSTIMSAYSMVRDNKRDQELESFYKEQCIYFYKELFKIPQFRVRGLTEDDYIKIQGETDYHVSKYKYWNPNSTKGNSVDSFYDSLYSSQKMLRAMIAYHIYKYCLQFEDMKVKVNTIEKTDETYTIEYKGIKQIRSYTNQEKSTPTEIGLISFLKYNTMEIIVPEISTWISNKYVESIKSPSVEAKEKWSLILYEFKKTINQAKTISTWHNGSLRASHIEVFYSAYINCADANPDDNWEDMDWEFRVIFCIKQIKKMDKCLSTYIYGSVGRDRLQNCEFGNKLTDVPRRVLDGKSQIFQVDFWECSAECLEGSTEIWTTQGAIKIKDMINSSSLYTTKSIYNNEMILDTINGVKVSGYVDELIELELENKEVIRCTLDHKFLLKDGKYKEAQYLTKDDELWEV